MAIPLIGSLGDLNQSANMALTSQRYLGESLTKMGAQIGETISQRQMFSDADKAAPFMQRAFLESFDTIAGGDINGGLGKAIGAAAQFSTNPILARIAQDGVRTAGLMTNAVMDQYQQPAAPSQTTGEQFETVQPLTESATSSYGSVPILARFEQSGWIPSVRTDSKDGTTITYKKEGELPQKVVIPKKVSDAFDDYNKADAAITEPTREYLASIGGTSNAKSIDLHVAESDNNEKPTAYYMTTTVLVPGKEKGTFIKKTVPYQKYDEFGIPTHVKIPASEGDKIQVMKDSQAVFTKGVEFQKDAGFAKQKTESQKKAADVAAMLKQKEAEIPMPFGMNEADAAKKIGLDPEKLKGEGIAQFKISAAKVIEDIIDDPKFVAARTAKNVNAMTTEFVNAYKNDMERNGSLASKFKPSEKKSEESAPDEEKYATPFQKKMIEKDKQEKLDKKNQDLQRSIRGREKSIRDEIKKIDAEVAMYDDDKNWRNGAYDPTAGPLESGGYSRPQIRSVILGQKTKILDRKKELESDLAKITGN